MKKVETVKHNLAIAIIDTYLLDGWHYVDILNKDRIREIEYTTSKMTNMTNFEDREKLEKWIKSYIEKQIENNIN